MSNENTQANNAPAPQSLVLDEQDISVAVGRTRCLWAQVTPADAENYTISWSSSNPSVASVSDGNVTAHATGPAVISAWIPGTSLSASCNVEVVPFVPVSSISVTPESWDLYVGDGYCLAAEVCPANATNPNITWSSKDEEIASVGEISGVVYAHKDGQTIITATVNDGTVEKTDTCILTVNTRPPVKGVKIEEDAVYMNQGERCTLHANVYPADAADRGVIWVSDNEAVAKVGTGTGEVEAISAGSTYITVTTRDGCFSASVPVRVYKETVVIRKVKLYENGEIKDYDGEIEDDEDCFVQVEFPKSGKTWRCVGVDLIDSGIGGERLERAKFNLYEDYVHSYDMRCYSEEEFRLLYAIDPHGVAHYVYQYAMNHYIDWSLKQIIEYKDEKFRVLFGREPLYFERCSNNSWQIARYHEPLSSVLSESETLFGTHMVWDEYTIEQFNSLALTIGTLAFSTFSKAGIKLLEEVVSNPLAINAVKGFCSWAPKVFSYYHTLVTSGDVLATATGDVAEKLFEEMNLEWAWDILSTWISIVQIRESGSIRADYERDVCDYLIRYTDYQIKMKLGDGEHSLQEIQAAFENNQN